MKTQMKKYVLISAISLLFIAIMPKISATEQQIDFNFDWSEPETPLFDLSVGDGIGVETGEPLCLTIGKVLGEITAEDISKASPGEILGKPLEYYLYEANEIEFPKSENNDPIGEIIGPLKDLSPEKLMQKFMPLPTNWNWEVDLDLDQVYIGISIEF